MSPLKDIAASILKTIFYPVLLWGDYHHRRRQNVRQGYISLSPEPYFLKSPRKRALTLPLPSNGQRRQMTHDQSQSALLTRLPFDVRHIIWKECLGGMIHMDIRDRRLVSIVCRNCEGALYNSTFCMCSRTEGPLRPQFHSTAWVGSSGPKRQLLALLMSCRNMWAASFPFYLG